MRRKMSATNSFRLAAVLLVWLCAVHLYGAEAAPLTRHELQDEKYRRAKELRRHRVLTHNGHAKMPVEQVDIVTQVEQATLNLGSRIPGLTQGDIMESPKGRKIVLASQNNSLRSKRKVINPNDFLNDHATWPYGIIPYAVDTSTYSSSVSSTVADTVRKALDLWEAQTCVQFLPADNVTAAIVNHTNYVRVSSGSGCLSYIGYVNNGEPQEMSLQEDSCFSSGVIMHEFGHVLGLIHEQARPDRESYTTVLFNNVISGYQGNFFKAAYPTVNIPVPYDVGSVMHYGSADFSAGGGATIVPRTLSMVTLLGQRGGASFYDAKAINTLYQCSGQCTLNCQNEGYARQLRNGTCSCVCPLGLGGLLCDISQFSCGGVITLAANGTPYILTSPNFPSNYNTGVKCSWLLKAPVGYIIQVVFTSFNVSATPTQCNHFLDVRSNLIGQPAPSVYCGVALPDTVSSRNDMQKNNVLIIFDASLSTAPAAPGFAANVSASIDGCLRDPCRGAPCTSTPGSASYSCQPPTGNFICDFENIISANCNTVKMSSPYNTFSQSIKQRTWEVYPSSIPQAADGNFYLGSKAEDHGLNPSNGSFRIIPYNFQGLSRCLKFQYYMDDDSAGYLNVYRAVNGVLGTPIFTVYGNHSLQWNQMQLEIVPSASSLDLIEVVFESLHDSQNFDDTLIGVDDMRYLAGACPTGPCSSDPCGTAVCTVLSGTTYSCAPKGIPTGDASCSFENWEDCSGLLNYLVTGDTIDWKLYSWKGLGTTWSNPTGPMGPATGLNYLYGQLFDRNPGNKIWLRIKQFSGNRCLRFKYSMFGANEGSLSVYRSLNMVYPGTKLWSISGNQGNAWRNAAVNVSLSGIAPNAVVELTLEVVRGSGYTSDYGLDDVSYTRGLCT